MQTDASSTRIEDRHIPPMSAAPAGFSIDTDLPAGFAAFYRPLHEQFTSRQQAAIEQRRRVLDASRQGRKPQYLAPSEAQGEWRIELPEWARDQRNQMTGPADDHELGVKMLNSGTPAVMIDLEDSMANEFERTLLGIDNTVAMYYGELTYVDQKRGGNVVRVKDDPAMLWTRVRGLHLSQAGIYPEPTSASLFDLALLAYKLDFSRLRHPLAIYISKSETADEALWWRDVFQAVANAKGLDDPFAIKTMALVESHPFAYQIEEFAYNLRDHLLGLNLGRWDYMASLIHYNLDDPSWVLPDRNTIPHDVAFFQNLRERIPEVCHRHGLLAIGGMTALFPDRTNPELNARAMAVLEQDKKNESKTLFDGAWTGHPDQNAIAVAQFPAPNQGFARKPGANATPDLRPSIAGVGEKTEAGTRAAVRTVIRYRHGYLSGRGASLLDGYMEDLATDRIYRLMIAQRVRHGMHSAADVTRIFDEELDKLLAEPDARDQVEAAKFREARRQSEAMITEGHHDPI
ncbi:MAG: malate synthase [Candidatus Eremiobacteraeota bacterium]|jgi:malate synthase|nr:malate synthase [Candidatus Eremiobacteraeota bacterium]